MKTCLKNCLISGCLLFALAFQLYAQNVITKSSIKSVTPEKLVDQLFSELSKGTTPGASVVIVKNGVIVYKKGYGNANLEYDIKNIPSTPFHIASLSKQFTAYSILLLQQDGKLSIDDDVRKYLPEFPDFGKTITLRNLATHTSGLREFVYLFGMSGWTLEDVISREDILKLVSKQKDLNFEPGTEFSYVNTGYVILGEVVSRVSGMPFAEFAAKRIFMPLHMNSTLANNDQSQIIKNRSYSYVLDANKKYKNKKLNFSNVTGSTGIVSTVEDLSKWTIHLGKTDTSDKEIFDQMNTRAVLKNGDTIRYALGQFIGKYKNLRTIDHGGSDAGFRSHMVRFPDQQFSVIVLGNDGSVNVQDMAYKIADIYLKDLIKEPTPKISPTSGEKKSILLSSEILDKYTGKFELRPGMIFDFTKETDHLIVNVTGQGTLPLESISSTTFIVKQIGATITFDEVVGGKAMTMTFAIKDQLMKGMRVKPFDGSMLANFTGDYFSEELNSTFKLVLEKGKLLAKHNRAETTELTQTGEDVFSGDKWFLGEVKFVRDSQNNISGFTVSSDRAKKVKFEKIKK